MVWNELLFVGRCESRQWLVANGAQLHISPEIYKKRIRKEEEVLLQISKFVRVELTTEEL